MNKEKHSEKMKSVGIEEFIKSKSNNFGSQYKTENGYFNVFYQNEYSGSRSITYGLQDFYAISLVDGPIEVHYGDRVINCPQNGLFITNPKTPFSWELLGDKPNGFCCVFSASFFEECKFIREYPLFKKEYTPVFSLSKSQLKEISEIYMLMVQELDSDFVYKYDVLRNLVLDLIYRALKVNPPAKNIPADATGESRIASAFTALLDQQFPIESPKLRMKLRFPAEFSDELSVSINHLNRILKTFTGKTTSQLIADRIIYESKIMVRHSTWSFGEIAASLGFDYPQHFTSFFKKHVKFTPKEFRRQLK